MGTFQKGQTQPRQTSYSIVPDNDKLWRGSEIDYAAREDDMGWNWAGNQIFGGNTLVGKILNPAGALYDKNTEGARREAEAATEAAKAQQAAAEAELKAQQDALTLQAQRAALASQTGDDSRTATVIAGGSVDAVLPATAKRRRGASANITVGL